MSINTSEMIWTVFNFIILMLLLKVFLYNPLLKFRDARKADVEEGIAKESEAQQALDESKMQLTEDIQKSNSEAKRILSQAKVADEQTKSEILKEAYETAALIRSESAQRVADEEKNELQNVEKSYSELVSLLTLQLLGTK